MRSLLCVLTAAVLAVAPATAGAARSARNCDGSITSADGAPAGVTIRRGHTACTTAKRVLRTYLHSEKPCEGSACRRKISGWTCLAASLAVFPRIASCNRGTRLIVAYAIED